ncbi:superoxide dismutase family protein [Poritiphilus flavus]|uniref:Superoxide dismutase family protein n=1 Tax=Poritiphilus flavus TaxID=2697053 RepID=A0A6L9EA15_9FLAO|nr:superoxide dismutase family protein [Poritiphilus flavus]NAS11627.1 superoxide dismutase family protein [Poritiphilus flavus]
MKKIKLVALGLVLLASYNCKEAKKEVKENTEEAVEEVKKEVVVESVKFTMEPKSDSEVTGEVLFTEKDGRVKMVARLSGLSEGEHAIHIHEKADCSSADGKSTGGHWNPTHEPHGKWGAAEGYHKGDIGNFVANAEGYATVEFDTDQWCMGCDDPNKNIIGKAVIVHQGVDDFTSQPSGAAGARISCTGIIQ